MHPASNERMRGLRLGGHTLHLILSATSHYAHSTLRRTLLWILHFTPHTQLTTMRGLRLGDLFPEVRDLVRPEPGQ